MSLSENAFISRFRPETNTDGSYYRQRYVADPVDRPLIEAAAASNCLWTFVNDGAGNGGPVPGLLRVNHEFYIICSVPFADDEDLEVEIEIDFCTTCGERFADTLDPPDEESVERSTHDGTLCITCWSD